MKTIERLAVFLQYKNMSLNAFDKALGFSNGYTGKQIKNTASIGSDQLEKIFSYFQELNPVWLLTGAGVMLTPDNTPVGKKDLPVDSSPKITVPPDLEEEVLQNPESIVRPKEPESVRPYVRPLKDVRPTLPENVRPTVRPTLESSAYPTVPKVVTVHTDEREAITIVGAKAAAGYLSGYGDPEYIESLPTLHIPQLRNGTYRGFEVTGESMVPTISNGAIVIGQYVERLEDIADNRLYVVVTFEDGIVVKRLLNRILQRNALVLRSDNFDKATYPVRQLHPADVQEVWEVKAALQFTFADPATVYIKIGEFEERFEKIEQRLDQLAGQAAS